MQRNPQSSGFVLVDSGNFTKIYKKDNIIEVIIEGYLENDPFGKIDCSKDILVEARKLCDENSKRFLPEINRKVINNSRGQYEFVYEMPFYDVRKISAFYSKINYESKSKLFDELLIHIGTYNDNISPKTTTAEKIVLELANNVWKNCNSIEVSGACGAVLAIEKACKNITTEPLFWDLKPFNMAMHGNQMIFLDPCFCMISTKDLLKIWKKNGIIP